MIYDEIVDIEVNMEEKDAIRLADVLGAFFNQLMRNGLTRQEAMILVIKEHEYRCVSRVRREFND